MTAAAFQATFSNLRIVGGRKVCQLIFEVPIEGTNQALEVLGGIPDPSKSVWVAVARLDPSMAAKAEGTCQGARLQTPAASESLAQNTGEAPEPSTLAAEMIASASASPRGEPVAKSKTAFRDMRLPNQAGIMCNTKSFQKFMAERAGYQHGFEPEATPEGAAEYVRSYCGVKSRADIRPLTPSGDRWLKLFDEYKAWLHAPECAA
jgi:hypothetical protein